MTDHVPCGARARVLATTDAWNSRRPRIIRVARWFAASLGALLILSPASEARQTDTSAPRSQPVPELSAGTFADPPAVTRPKYRWWMPVTALDDQELRNEIQQMKGVGAGGFEIVPFSSPGAGNTSNPVLETNGFGTPYWSHKVEVMTTKAKQLGLIADQTLGVRWPPAVNTVYNFNQPAAAKQLIFGRELNQPGTSRSGPIPETTTDPPTVSTTLCAPASAGDRAMRVASISSLARGDDLTIGSDATADVAKIRHVDVPPAYCTPLTTAVAAGDTTVSVKSTDGLGAGVTVTLGSGSRTETAKIASVGTAGADGSTPIRLTEPLAAAHPAGETLSTGDTTVSLGSALSHAHTAGDQVVDTAHEKLVAVLVAQCSTACSTDGDAPRQLDVNSVRDVTDQVDNNGNLDYTFPKGNGNPWFVIDFYWTADGQNLAGYTPTTPNYITDHLSARGARVLTRFYDRYVLDDPATAAALRSTKIGVPSMFEDSLELGGFRGPSAEKWTPDMLRQWRKLRGYDLTRYLPALAGIGSWAHLISTDFSYDGASTPYFDFGGDSKTDPTTIGSRIRWDYAQTWSDLYYKRYVKTLQSWAEARGMTMDIQPHGEPIDGTAAGLHIGTPQGEGLEFNDSVGHPVSQFKIYASGVNVAGNSTVPCECTAISGQVWDTTVRQTLAVDFRAPFGGGSPVARPSANADFAGGMNWVIYHGFPYLTAPPGSGSEAVWPGYSYGGNTSFSEAYSPRIPQWDDYRKVNAYFGRTSLVLRQGHADFDVGVYGESLGTAGQGAYRPSAYYYEDTSAMAARGYSYAPVGPEQLHTRDAVYRHGVLFPGRTDYDALVLTDQPQIRLDAARRILALARDGLPVVIVGDKAPSSITTPGYNTAQDLAVQAVMTRLYSYADDGRHRVARVADESGVPAALERFGITPDAAHTSNPESTAILSNHRATRDADYYYLYNQSGDRTTQTITLRGRGIPYRLDAWTGKATPIAEYTTGRGTVSIDVDLAGYDGTIVTLSPDERLFGASAGARHATGTTADSVRYDRSGDLVARAAQGGRYGVSLGDGRSVSVTVPGSPDASTLTDWSLTVDSWTPGPSDLPGDTAHTDIGPIHVTAADDGKLPTWASITPANGFPVDLQDVSGIGSYTSTVTLPQDWSRANGAYLDLGAVTDTSTLTVNGRTVPPYDYVDPTQIDIGPYLHAGENTIEVRVASTLLNAVRVAPGTGASGRARDSSYGLVGPVRLTPYAEAAVTKHGHGQRHGHHGHGRHDHGGRDHDGHGHGGHGHSGHRHGHRSHRSGR